MGLAQVEDEAARRAQLLQGRVEVLHEPGVAEVVLQPQVGERPVLADAAGDERGRAGRRLVAALDLEAARAPGGRHLDGERAGPGARHQAPQRPVARARIGLAAAAQQPAHGLLHRHALDRQHAHAGRGAGHVGHAAGAHRGDHRVLAGPLGPEVRGHGHGPRRAGQVRIQRHVLVVQLGHGAFEGGKQLLAAAGRRGARAPALAGRAPVLAAIEVRVARRRSRARARRNPSTAPGAAVAGFASGPAGREEGEAAREEAAARVRGFHA